MMACCRTFAQVTRLRGLTLIVWGASALTCQADHPTVEQQTLLAEELARKVQRSEIWKDDQGNVTGLILINHQALDRVVGPRPGVTDLDLARLRELPHLNALNLEAQPVGDAGLKVLRHFPQLKQVGFHYMAKAPGARATPDFIEVIDGMRELEILEIKHNFRMKAIRVESLQGPFPSIWRLVLDTPLTAEQTLHIIGLCPQVKDLQLHRSQLTPAQLRRLAVQLPKLEVLWFKPKGDLTREHLAAIAEFKQLRIFSPQHYKNELPFEQGWEHLLKLPELRRLEVAGSRAGSNALAFERLKQQRPSLVVTSTLTRSRNYDGL